MADAVGSGSTCDNHGIDALSAEDKIKMDVAQSLREDFLQQNAFFDTDSYTSLEKQNGMLKLIFHYYKEAVRAAAEEVSTEEICAIPAHEKLARAKLVPEDAWGREFAAAETEITAQINELIRLAQQED